MTPLRVSTVLVLAVAFLQGVAPASAQGLPAPWVSDDIGQVGYSGYAAEHDAGTFSVTGSGADIWKYADQFHFAYVELPHDGYLEARVTAIDGAQPWAKAGVMIRQSLAPDSRHDSFFITPGNGAVYQRRYATGAPSYSNSLAPHATGAPLYVRIRRQSQFVTLQYSADGVNWTGTGGGDWGVGTVYVGLAVTSHSNSARATGTFDNVRVEVRPRNIPSDVTITQPAHGQEFWAPARVPIGIEAHDPDYGIKEVSAEMLVGETWSIFATFYTSQGWTSPYRTTTRELYPGTYRFRARVVDNQNGITYSDPVTVRVTDGSLPAAWQNSDIGPVGAAGSFSDGDPIVVEGSGADVWGSADAFHYVYQRVTGDWEIVVRVGSLEAVHRWTKAGIMFREHLGPGSRHASWFATGGSGVAYQRRLSEGGYSEHRPGPMTYAPVWLRLVRTGNLIAAYYRHQHEQGWRLEVADVMVNLPATIHVGLAVTSHEAGTLATATFDTLRSERVEWNSRDIGQVGARGAVVDHGRYVSIEGSGSDIWGTSDAFHFMHREWTGDGAITTFVHSLENTNPWAKAGVMFRESLTPGARHVTLVATPGRGLAMQYRPETDGLSYNAALAPGTIPKWVRIVRRGDLFTGAVSDDGFTWRTVGSVRLTTSGPVHAGLVVTSHADGTLATGTFRSPYLER